MEIRLKKKNCLCLQLVFLQTGSNVALSFRSATGEPLVYRERERRQIEKTVQDIIVLWYIKSLVAARRIHSGAIAQ